MKLIVTCPRHFEEETIQEIKNILEILGDQNTKITKSNFSGILFVDTQLNGLRVVEFLKERMLDEPWTIRYMQRVIPILVEVEADPKKIVEVANQLIKFFHPKGQYRVTIEKRGSTISSELLITEIANNVTNSVSLENPKWIMLIEIIGGFSGVSILKPDLVFSIAKFKRSFSD